MTVVPKIELLQAIEAVEGGRLYVGDVVGVKPQHGGGGGEVATEQPLDLVVLQEDTLALSRDALGDGVEVVGLAGHGARRGVADAVTRARQRNIQAEKHQQQLHPTIAWQEKRETEAE